MTLREDTQLMAPAESRHQIFVRRWFPLLVVLLLLVLLGFYTVTDDAHLQNSLLLDGADWSGYAFCHRITDRSFTINGRQFPLCARCSGMYLGVALVVVVTLLAGRMRRANLPPLKLLLLLLGFIALMGVDGINSYLHFFPQAPHLYEPRNWLRLATGMGTGLAMGLILLPALAQTLWRRPDYRKIIDSRRELAALLILALVTILLLLSNQATLLYVLALTSIVGLLFILTALNTIVFLVLFRQDGRATTWRQTGLPLLLGFLAAVVVIAIISALRFNLTGTMSGFPGL